MGLAGAKGDGGHPRAGHHGVRDEALRGPAGGIAVTKPVGVRFAPALPIPVAVPAGGGCVSVPADGALGARAHRTPDVIKDHAYGANTQGSTRAKGRLTVRPIATGAGSGSQEVASLSRTDCYDSLELSA